MVVAAKTYSSFSRSHRLERACFSHDGLHTTTAIFQGGQQTPIGAPICGPSGLVNGDGRRRSGPNHKPSVAVCPVLDRTSTRPGARDLAGLACKEMAD